MNKIIALVTTCFGLCPSHVQTGPIPYTYTQKYEVGALVGQYPKKEEFQDVIAKFLDEMDKGKTLPPFRRSLFELISLHYEACMIKNLSQEIPRRELEKYNSILERDPMPVPRRGRLFRNITQYLFKRSSPDVSELWWRLLLSSSHLTASLQGRENIWSNIVKAQINQGAFSSALQTADQWLAYEKNSPSSAFKVAVAKTQIAFASNDLALMSKSTLNLSTLAKSPEENYAAELAQTQSLYLSKKYSECRDRTKREALASVTIQRIRFRELYIECLTADKDFATAEAQLNALTKDVAIDKSSEAAQSYSRAEMDLKIEKKDPNAFAACLGSLSTFHPESVFEVISRFTVCSFLKKNDQAWPPETLKFYDERRFRFDRLGARIELVRSELDILKASFEKTPERFNALKVQAVKLFAPETLIAKAARF